MSVPVTRAILRDLAPGEAAALWKIQHDSGGPAEAGLFEEWLGASDANGLAWAALGDAWSLFDEADDPMFAELRQSALSSSVQRGRRRYAVAAIGLVVAAAGGMLLLPRMGQRSAQLATQDGLYETRGDARTVVLADGSQVALSHNTQIRVTIAEGRRSVILDRGRALFSVSHDETHPFKVTAGPWSVTDIGTRFEIGLHASGMRVALFEGGVRIEDGHHVATVLSPGQQYVASLDQPGEVSSIKAPDGPIATSGMAEFDTVTLAQAVQQFNQANAVQLVIVDPKIAGFHITGRFSLNDPVRFADKISQILPVRVKRVDPEHIELRAGR